MVLLFAVNPFTVGFTHGTGANTGPSCVQSAPADPGAATARAWKLSPSLALNVNFPAAVTLALPSGFNAAFPFAPQIVTTAPPRG